MDTNLLVYAHRSDSPWHKATIQVVKELAEGRHAWAIPWPCVHEFFSIVTNSRIYSPSSTVAEALKQIELWNESPYLTFLSESPNHWVQLQACVSSGRIAGPQIHDAKIAAICLDHGVVELLSADRDFGRFAKLRVRNPLITS